MATLSCSLDKRFFKDFALDKNKMTIGRNPKCDIVIDSPTVSGSHAQVTKVGLDYLLEDTNSTNGTFVNHKAIKKHVLQVGDTVDIGHYQFKFLREDATKTPVKEAEPPLTAAADNIAETAQALKTTANIAQNNASLLIMNGAQRGEFQPLKKTLNTFGKAGLQVAVITKRPPHFVISQIEGTLPVTINSVALQTLSYQLQHEDVIDVAGIQMQFLMSA